MKSYRIKTSTKNTNSHTFLQEINKLYHTALNRRSERSFSWKHHGPQMGRPGILPACFPGRHSAAFGSTCRRRGRGRSEPTGRRWWTTWGERRIQSPDLFTRFDLEEQKRTFRWRRGRRCTSAWWTCACVWEADTVSCPGSRSCGPACKKKKKSFVTWRAASASVSAARGDSSATAPFFPRFLEPD